MNSSLPKLHPLMTIAAVSITAFSLLGIGAITGLVTPAHSDHTEALPISASTPAETEAAAEQKDQRAETLSMPKEKSTVSNPSAVWHIPTIGKTNTDSKASASSPRSEVVTDTKVCAHCGQIESIGLVKHDGDGSGLGAIAGGVTGGVIGNQIGKGKGSTLMTILGIGSGAYAGHTIEKKVKATSSYVVKVRMQDGSARTVTQTDKPSFAVGDQVKIANGGLAAIS